MKQQQQMSCRDMELLCRQQAVFDCEHRWKWLGQAERWGHLGACPSNRIFLDEERVS